MSLTWKRIINSLIIIVLIGSFLLANPRPVAAGGVITVTTTKDLSVLNTTDCTLRWAIIAANNDARYGGCNAGVAGTVDQIYLPASSADYILSIDGTGEDYSLKGDLDIRSNMAIIGATPATTRIFGSSKDRIFHVISASNVTIQNLKIYGGDLASVGGGILIENSTVKLSRLVVMSNHAASAGGGIKIGSGSVVTIDSSSIANNTSQQAGGILNEGTLILSNSLISNNFGTMTDASGGLDNNAQLQGYAKVTNTTITGNRSSNGGAGISSTAHIEILNSTIVGNYGTGLQVASTGYTTSWVKNTIIANQAGASDQNCVLETPALFASQGHNIESQNTCGFNTTLADQVNVANVGLVDLANNGGPTLTYALTASSPAVDTGDDNGCPLTDQRLYGRPGDGNNDGIAHCDIGAFELGGIQYSTFLPLLVR